MMYRLCQFVDFLKIKAANAFASRSVRRKLKFQYQFKYGKPTLTEAWAREVYRKFSAIKRCDMNLDVLALGSSHGVYGFLPGEKSFNLCGTSQDLYLSYELYKRFSELPMLKTVVLFYSVFSPGFEVERSIEMERCLYYRYFYGIPYRFHADGDFAHKSAALKLYVEKTPYSEDCNYYGQCNYDWFTPALVSTNERVESHLKNNQRHNGQTEYVRKMAELAKVKGHQLVVVIPPAREDYRNLLPAKDVMFRDLLRVLKSHTEVKLLDFLGDKTFVNSDFGDMDHLNRNGAEKLTAKIIERLRRTEIPLVVGANLLKFPVHGDHTGSLIALEKSEDFPFEIKRVYYIWGTAKDVIRGHHAHKNLEQVIVCTSGSCDFILDDGTNRETIHLDSPAHGLYIKNNIWREFTNFSPDCVVMVLASEHYNEADYIRDYGEFLRSISNGNG